MKAKLFLPTFAAAFALAAPVNAQTAQLPTSEAAIGSFDVPVIVIPAEAFVDVDAVAAPSAVETISVSLSSAVLVTPNFNFPREQDELLDLVALSAFGASVDSFVEGSSAVGDAANDTPTVGTASFTGQASGSLITGGSVAQLDGDVAVDVDFATGSVESTFTNMVSQPATPDSLTAAAGLTEWRDFSSVGSMTDGSGLFAGDAATDDGLLTGSVAGMIDGTSGAAGLWSLAGDDETAFGTFVATSD